VYAVELMLKCQLQSAMRALDKIIPTYCTRVCTYTSNIIKSVPDSTLGNCDVLGELRSVKGAGLGMLSANVNVDSATDIPHTERDMTPTVISVPKQDGHHEMGINFQFSFTKTKSLFIDMKPLTTFAYSALFVTHRQNHDHGKDCINISSYGNQRLFWNSRKSLIRLHR
jgi:hypothetical protein